MRKTESITIHESKMFTTKQQTFYLKGKVTNRSIQVHTKSNHEPIKIGVSAERFDKCNINILQRVIHDLKENIAIANGKINRYEDLVNNLEIFLKNHGTELERLNVKPSDTRLTETNKTDMMKNFANRHDIVLTAAKEYLEKANWDFTTAGNYLLTDRHKKIRK